ncbi:MAG: NAD(P)H-binding protein, partial [Ureaplasma sp.]|nr:NAD(P)H-binding protein [Ureaplasma sp.]
MKIAILGASGRFGNILLEKASKNNNFEVTGFSRKPIECSNAKLINKDLFELTKEDLNEFDAVVSAFGVFDPNRLDEHTKLMKHLLNIINPKTRLIIIGGAGSLFVNTEHTIMLQDTPEFPKEYLGVASASTDAYNYLKTFDNILWTYFSPSAIFDYEGDN